MFDNIRRKQQDSTLVPQHSPYQLAILTGLQRKPVYQGTVPRHVKEQRRAANKVARVSHRRNHRGGAR